MQEAYKAVCYLLTRPAESELVGDFRQCILAELSWFPIYFGEAREILDRVAKDISLICDSDGSVDSESRR